MGWIQPTGISTALHLCSFYTKTQAAVIYYKKSSKKLRPA